ncbi:hypothetical protein EC957_009950 [Mortierella hygrophila]|uniref:Uncharacterized protein n=1 Tax=Mortierella hygrophila TaxID=979708 RepID=A0A9P6FAF7_9FUNG|nr:hypothetical protein EC957_009950 [Mortierella hygrophila]
MSRLEAMFPPLHDSVDSSSSSSTTTPSSTSPAAEAFMSALDQGIQRPSSHVELAVSPKPTRPQRLVPPPILIPKDIMQQNKPMVAAPMIAQNQNQQHLPSPVPSATSPESPSSLAIHLYVHHHHHHHPQESSSSSAVVLQDGITASSSSGSASLSPSNGSAPMVLLSPLTFPHPSVDHPFYQQQHQQHLQGTTKSAAAASLPSPPLSNPEIELSQLPSPLPVQLVSLLPPLSIPSANNNSKTNDALLTPPTSARSLPLIASSATKSDLTPTNDDTTSTLPWFNHPNSLANTATKNQPNNNHYQQRRHRQQNRNHQPRSRLPDPALASQLLSTISSKDLARLYVHAAHHLHSHQPIRRYVMMKMIMTQAELAQYGRLRAEMPRAPGPSTGAQPKRNGFGSPAQSGFEFRPKRSSRLGHYMYSAAAFVPVPAPAARWGTAASGRSWGDEEDMVMEVWNEKAVVTKKKPTSLPWTQSLSSLVSLTKRKSTPSSSTSSSSSPSKPTSSVSEPNLYCSSRRLEELELGHDHPNRANTVLQQQQIGNRSSSSSRIRRRVVGGGRMYSEDDYDDGEGSEDTETGDDFEGEEEDDFDDEELDEEQEEEEKPSTYWSMLRTRSNNNQPRKRDRRNSSATDQHHKEARLHLSMQQQDKHNQYYQQQQQQQQQQKIISLQQLDPQVIIYTSSTKQNTSSTTNKSKSSARRRTALNHTSDNNGSLVPSSSSPYSSPNSSSSSHFPNGTILSTGSGSATAPFTETYGVSGLLMLALFFVFLFLLEGTNHFYKVQSALLSIIL